MSDKYELAIGKFKRADGVMDWYRVLDVPSNASELQIEVAFQGIVGALSSDASQGDIEAAVRCHLAKKAREELCDPKRRQRYDAFCRHTLDHAYIRTTAEQAKTQAVVDSSPRLLGRIFRCVNTPLKRVALVLTPVLAVISIYKFISDMDRGEPSLTLVVSSLLTLLAVTLAFSRLSDWIQRP